MKTKIKQPTTQYIGKNLLIINQQVSGHLKSQLKFKGGLIRCIFKNLVILNLFLLVKHKRLKAYLYKHPKIIKIGVNDPKMTPLLEMKAMCFCL